MVVALVYVWMKSIWANMTVHIVFNLFNSLIISRIVDKHVIMYVVLSTVVLINSLVFLYKRITTKEIEMEQIESIDLCKNLCSLFVSKRYFIGVFIFKL